MSGLPPGAACAATIPGGLDLAELKYANRRPAGRYVYQRGGVTVERIWADDLAQARALCATCPVLDACTELALRGTDVDGFAAGMTRTERREWREANGVRVRPMDTRHVMPARVAVADAPDSPLTDLTVAAVVGLRARGFEREDIAAALDVPERTVLSALTNARRRARRKAAS